MSKVEKHIEFDEEVVKLKLDSYATTDGRNCPHVKVVGHGWGGRDVYQGPISDVPSVSLIQCPTVLSAHGDGMADFRNVPNLSDGDRVFIEHYGWHTVRIDKRGYSNLVKDD